MTRLLMVVTAVTMLACASYVETNTERVEPEEAIRFVTETEAQDCERVSELSATTESRYFLTKRAQEFAVDIGADAILIESISNEIEWNNSYTLKGVALRCG